MTGRWPVTALRQRRQTRTGNIKDRRGTSAIEFALIAPVVMIALIGVFDVVLAMILHQELYTAAHTIVTSASSLAVQPDNTTSLTVAQVQQALSAIYAAVPTLRNGRQVGVRSATLTSINFQQTNPSCNAVRHNGVQLCSLCGMERLLP